MGRMVSGAVKPGRRADLQGVRALAVVLVALNHAGVPFLKGGFVGVDVFFVLSGFFITRLLLDDGFGAADSGRRQISVQRFYARRIRRILPAACLTLVATNLAAYLLLGYSQANQVLSDSVAATFFYANFHFAALAANYFAQGLATSPEQHYWSLSVEEQFYVVWPWLLIGGFWLARAWSARSRGTLPERRAATFVLGALITVLCMASLIWSIHATDADAQSAYFSTFARACELALGGAVALALPALTRSSGEPLRVVGSWLGLAMVLAAALLFSLPRRSPGLRCCCRRSERC